MKFSELDEYKKDLKKLSKRYRTLKDDLEVVKKVLRVNPAERPPFSYRIDGLGITTCVIKVRKIACRSLKGKGVNTGLRLIYAHFENKENPETEKIVLVEIYHKSDKANEDRGRILMNFV
ncbi:MAG: hypothetical protein K9J13_06005 [Saprospiraceae bacterium]|nr:hypothetical protein [Saprospiraceae bacterium]